MAESIHSDVSMKESLRKLEVRIRAHRESANFDVSDWIEGYVGRKPRTAILDLGCGNGNHLGIYLEHVGREGRGVGLVSSFAIYNAADPRSTIRELQRVAQPGAEIVLIGPTSGNARELHDLNARLTGRPVDELILVRSDRIRREIVPIVREVFGNSREEILSSRLTFPSPEQFVQYFESTLFCERLEGVTREQMLSSVPRDLVVSKEMIAAVAVN